MIEVPKPPEDVMRDREAAFAEVENRLGPWLRLGGLRVSPLGPAYSSDVDAYVTQAPDPSVLAAAGWLPLDGLLASIGIGNHGCWAVVVDGRVVGSADIYVKPPPDPVRHVLDRCRREGAGARELAELEVLRSRGHQVGAIPARRVTAGWRARANTLRRVLRQPRVVVAISGVDGAGKSTLTQRLVDDLVKAGVPATWIWARPGVTVTSGLDRLARAVKRVLGENPDPGNNRAAVGKASEVRSRRGLVGRAWNSLILLDQAFEVWRRYVSTSGVVIFDRHIVDAEVTLQVLYPGQHTLAWRLFKKVIPEADLRFHLEVPPEVAMARKPDDLFGPWALQRQIEEYERCLDGGVIRLDGQEHPDRLVLQVLERLTQGNLG